MNPLFQSIYDLGEAEVGGLKKIAEMLSRIPEQMVTPQVMGPVVYGLLAASGLRKPLEQDLRGYMGAEPSYSVMDPDANMLRQHYRGGEMWGILDDASPGLLLAGGAARKYGPQALSAMEDVHALRAPRMAGDRGLLGMPDMRVPTKLGILAGEGAATADKAALATAKKLAKEGANSDYILRETGWWQGPDKKWRFEIDDSAARITLPEGMQRGQIAALGDALHHPKFFEAYPQLRNAEFYWNPSALSSQRGKFWSYGDNRPTLEINVDADPQRLSTTLHELQHGVQDVEGFAKGGNLTFAYQDPKAFDVLREMRQRLTKPVSFEEYVKTNWANENLPDDVLKWHYGMYLEDNARLAKNPPGWLERAAQESAAQEYYKRLAGEAEARLVQQRMGLQGDELRRMVPWPDDYDVPLDKQIVKMGGTGPAESIDVWHGSPHKFDRASSEHIGRGEGAQAYGHGLYWAEAPGTAKTYADDLGTSLKVGDKPLLENNSRFQRTLSKYLSHSLIAERGNREAVLKELRDDLKAVPDFRQAEYQRYIDELEKHWDDITVSNDSYLYRARLAWPDPAREAADPLGPQHFLDWDRPLRESDIERLMPAGTSADDAIKASKEFERLSQAVLDKTVPEEQWNKAYLDPLRRWGEMIEAMRAPKGKWGYDPAARQTGGKLYRDLQSTMGGAEQASEFLRSKGIPGIAYLDAMSRKAGEGTRNYVTFDDNLVTLLERNGEPLGGLLRALMEE